MSVQTYSFLDIGFAITLFCSEIDLIKMHTLLMWEKQRKF